MAKLLVVQQEYAKALDYCARGGVEYTECLKNLAEDLYVKGRYSEACDYYKMFAPQTFNTLLNASKCFAKVLGWKESLDYANKALGVQHADSGALVIKFQALVGLGKQQMDAGHHDQAITYLNQALQIKQDDQEVKNLLGEALITIGVYQQALECYPAGTEKYKFCLERLAEEEFRNPDYTKALKHYEDLLLRLPENQGLKNKIGSILQRLGKDEEALNYYVKDTTEYIAAARKVLQDLRLEGQNKLDQHKAYEAIKCYKEVLSKQPALLSADECRNNPIYLKLSECYRGTEKPEKSLFWVNKVLAENPDDRKAKVEKARSLESIGESLVGKSIYGDAIMHLKEALSISASLLSLADVKKIKIKLGKVYEKLGEIYGKVEDNNSALYLYRELYSVAPEDEQVKIRMGSILEKLGEFDEAAKYFEAGSEDWKRVNAKRFENILKEGDTLFENKNYNQAVGKYEEALKIKPNQASVLVKKAKCFNISKEYDKALNCVNEIDVSLSHEIGLVEEIKNIKLQALKSKGEYLKQIDQLEKAAECFAEVLELQPTEEHRVQLCLVYYDSKQYDIALNHLRGIRKEYLRTVEDSKVKLKFAWLFMKQEIYDEALNLFSQVNGSEKAEANVGCGIAYNRLGEQSYRQDNYNKAKRYFEDALKYDSDELYEINLGFTHMALKEYEKSLGCFGRVDQDERKLLGQEEALNRLIEKNKKSEDIGQIAKVLEYYDQLFEISQQHNHHQDRNLDYLCNKARFILDRTADYDNARRVAEKAKEIDPTYELAQQILDECDGLLGMGSFIPEVDF